MQERNGESKCEGRRSKENCAVWFLHWHACTHARTQAHAARVCLSCLVWGFSRVADDVETGGCCGVGFFRVEFIRLEIFQLVGCCVLFFGLYSGNARRDAQRVMVSPFGVYLRLCPAVVPSCPNNVMRAVGSGPDSQLVPSNCCRINHGNGKTCR